MFVPPTFSSTHSCELRFQMYFCQFQDWVNNTNFLVSCRLPEAGMDVSVMEGHRRKSLDFPFTGKGCRCLDDKEIIARLLKTSPNKHVRGKGAGVMATEGKPIDALWISAAPAVLNKSGCHLLRREVKCSIPVINLFPLLRSSLNQSLEWPVCTAQYRNTRKRAEKQSQAECLERR